MSPGMDDIDHRILNIIQGAFPLDPEPFKVLAAQVGIREEEAYRRVQELRNSGIIRRIGAVFDPKKMGFTSTLCAARVPEEKLRAFVDAVNANPGVTHNYRRSHDYNVWFTFIAPTEEHLNQFLKDIKQATGITDILSLRAVRTFKINARFDF